MNDEPINQLTAYTLSLGDDNFIHQHVVDAYTAQTATEDSKLIAVVFALAGLYLYLERNYTGREVQAAHGKMARNKKFLEAIVLPSFRGDITVEKVLDVKQDSERTRAIHEWCSSVWNAFSDQHPTIIQLTEKLLTT